MSINGGYGIMLQLSSAIVQDILTEYFEANRAKFSYETSFNFPFPNYGIFSKIILNSQLGNPRINLKQDKRFSFNFDIASLVSLTSEIVDQDGNSEVPPPPINISIVGTFELEIEAEWRSDNQGSRLNVAFKNLVVENLDLKFDRDIILKDEKFRNFLTAMVRRSLLVILTDQVVSLPISNSVDESALGMSVKLDFKNVTDDNQSALVLLLQCNNETVDYHAVQLGLSQGSACGLYTETWIMNENLSKAAAKLEGRRLSHLEDQPSGNFFKRNMRLRGLSFVAQSGHIRTTLDVEFTLLKKVISFIDKILCWGPCKRVCRKVVKKVVNWVLDDGNVIEVRGHVVPMIVSGKFTADPNLDTSVAKWVYAALYTATSLIPVVSILSPIIAIIGPLLLKLKISEAVEEWDKEYMVEEFIPSTNARILIKPDSIVWHGETMGIIGVGSVSKPNRLLLEGTHAG
ncbi:hypothetical protein [Lentilitoribacter sp. Alg239-R112]|uniref:hypothetical protein n=1 Tax=Lentilitoribacter sp. Alg239-R112 TaxID=2305987 RepID=UPI0013A6DB0D|nr:hypothetical protein [Lentilitoribacter sp. Alg239-R112]